MFKVADSISKNYKDLTSLNLFFFFFDVLPIAAETDARKLFFYGLGSNALKRNYNFDTRLVYSFLYNLARTQFAFIPKFLQYSRFVRTHELLNYKVGYRTDHSPTKRPAWRKIVRTSFACIIAA